MESESKIILVHREKTLLNEDIRYILFAQSQKKTTFSVTVVYGEDCETASLGTSLERATEIFDAIWNGTVTPCALADVVTDLQYSYALS